MATTARPISELAVGIRDTSGAVVASGKARFYINNTLTIGDYDTLRTALNVLAPHYKLGAKVREAA